MADNLDMPLHCIVQKTQSLTCLRFDNLAKATKLFLGLSDWVAATNWRLCGKADRGPPSESLTRSKLRRNQISVQEARACQHLE